MIQKLLIQQQIKSQLCQSHCFYGFFEVFFIACVKFDAESDVVFRFVINADSMQIYQGLSVGTAKPTAEEQQGIPHHLMDFLPPETPYSVADFTVRDYVGGVKDLKDGVIRLIGNPETRYREDPVRMLRAVRFAAKLGMRISPETAEPIPRLATLLNDIPPARLFEESLKLLQAGYGYETYKLLCEYHLFQPLFPTITRYFTENGDSPMERIIEQVLKNTDTRIHNDMRVNPAFLFAAMFWYPLLETAQKIAQESGLTYHDAFALAMNDVLDEACRSLAIPKRLTTLTRDIWQLQLRMSRRQGKRAWKLLEHPKFRAAYDLLALRAEVERNAELQRLVKWWGEFQVSAPPDQKGMLNELDEEPSPRRRTRRPRKRAPRREGTA